MTGPRISVDLDIIEENTRNIVSFCTDRGISVTGVTKVTCGMPSVARALLKGGVETIGESRLENILRLRAAGITAPFWLLRIPPLSAVDEIVTSCSLSLNSEIGVIRALSAAAQDRDLVHDILLMIDMGDLREGIWPDDLLPTVQRILELPGIRLRGLGTNLTCYGGVLPSRKNMETLVGYRKKVEDRFSISLDILSGGNSSSLDLLRKGNIPQEVNNLRLGESLMLGRETAYQQVWPGARTDAFVLEAELIEAKEKPSIPIGETGLDAFGEKPSFTDRGKHLRGILNIGREDVKAEGLTPTVTGLTILGASSDHLLVDLGDKMAEIGTSIGFLPDYGALLAAMTSAYVTKEVHRSGSPIPHKTRPIMLTGEGWNRNCPESDKTLGEIFAEDLSTLPDHPKVFIEPSKVHFNEESRPILLDHSGRILEILEKQEGRGSCGLVWLTPRMDGSPLMDYIRNHGGLSSSENIVVIGLREAGHEAREFLEQRRITAYTMEDIDLLGLRHVMSRSLHQAAAGNTGVILRYDSSVSDGGNEGLTRRETFLAMEMTSRSGLMTALDISASQIQDIGEINALKHYVAAAMGRRILQHR